MTKVLVSIVLLVLAFAALVRLLEKQMIFFPTKFPDGFWQTEDLAYSPSDHWIDVEPEVRLHAWHFRHPDARGTILLLHGNAGNLSHRSEYIQEIMRQLPVSVFIPDYRGYGRSTGKISEAGMYADVLAAYDYLHENLQADAGTVIILGRSLGGAAAVDLAARRPAAGLVLESTFTSAADMAQSIFGPFPVARLLSTELNSTAKITTINTPKLHMHGTRDEVVPFALGKKLYQASPEPRRFVALAGAHHNDTYVVASETYFSELKNFVLDCLKIH